MTTVVAEQRTPTVVQRVRHEVGPDPRVEAVTVDDARFEVIEADPRHRIVSFEDRGPSARIGALVAGVTATATATAPAGSITTTRSVTVLGEPATATASAPRGAISVNEEIPGQTAAATAAAPAGTVSTQRNVTVALPVAAAVAAAAPGVVVGQRNITIAGDVSAATAAAPAGAVVAIRNALVAGQPAAAYALAPDGVILAVRNATVAGQPATATADAPAGKIEFIIHALVVGQVATATALAPDGSVLAVRNVTVVGDVATAAAQAAAGVVSAVRNATVSVLVAAASAQAPAGTVQAVRNVGVAGSVATASAVAPAGSITAVINVPYYVDAAFVNPAASTDYSAQIPAAAAVGDMLLLYVARMGSTASIAVPTGWTQQYNNVYGASRVACFSRTMQSGDTGPLLSGTSSTKNFAGVLAIRNANVVNQLSASSSTTDYNQITTPSITTTKAPALIVRMAGWTDPGVTGASVLWSNSTAVSSFQYTGPAVAFFSADLQTAAGATGTSVATVSGAAGPRYWSTIAVASST